MKRTCAVLLAICLLPEMSLSQTVVVNDNLVLTPDIGPLDFTVYQNADATDYTGIWFTFNGTSITPFKVLLDEGSDWYLVQPGDRFTPENIEAGMFTPIYVTEPYYYASVEVGKSDFYLGVRTGIGWGLPNEWSVFGWAHIRPEHEVEPPFLNLDLVMVENVMSYDSPGIIVGTTTLVAEPSAQALSGGFIIALFAFVRRRHIRAAS